MNKSKFIPSMFHRRLIGLMSVVCVLIVVLIGQMFRISVVQGAQRLLDAEAKLDRKSFLPTYRGRILDRYDRVLAEDRASYDIAVEYDVITGGWIRTQAAAQAKKELGRSKWSAMSPEAREMAIKERLSEWERCREQVWEAIMRLGGITREELQHRLDDIQRDVSSTAAYIWDQQRLMDEDKYGVADTDKTFKPQPIREQREAHVILANVPDAVAYEFRSLDSKWPGMIEVQDSHRREYPWLNCSVTLSRNSLPMPIRVDDAVTIDVRGVADHMLGSVRHEVWDDDLKRRPFTDPKTRQVIDLGGYRPGDRVGARGIERVMEDQLRGMRGVITERRDRDEKTRVEPVFGRDVQLTLDIALQARVQAVLSPQFGLTRVQPWQNNVMLPEGRPLNAAAVVLEIETGEVLAMVSMPTIAMGESMPDIEREISGAMVNRPVEAVYPPGSIIKPLVLSAAVSEHLHSLDATIECTGHYFKDKLDAARCWIYREKYGMQTHGALKADEALARSCNIFFYTLGDRLGLERECDWFHRFGMGSRLNVGLMYEARIVNKNGVEELKWVGESEGEVPDAAAISKMRDSGQWKFSQVIMGIGQGPIAWTPVQAANAYATLARGGIIRDATLLLDDSPGRRAKRRADLNLDSRLVGTALEGLRQAAMEHHGTGNHLTYEGIGEEPLLNAVDVQVWAKTGTAQAPALRLDTNGDGVLNEQDGHIAKLDHSWFVGLVGPKTGIKPLYAISVIVEYGGSGGRTAGPVANQIIHAMQSEGYLPGDPNANTSKLGRAPSVDPEPEIEHEVEAAD